MSINNNVVIFTASPQHKTPMKKGELSPTDWMLEFQNMKDMMPNNITIVTNGTLEKMYEELLKCGDQPIILVIACSSDPSTGALYFCDKNDPTIAQIVNIDKLKHVFNMMNNIKLTIFRSKDSILLSPSIQEDTKLPAFLTFKGTIYAQHTKFINTVVELATNPENDIMQVIENAKADYNDISNTIYFNSLNMNTVKETTKKMRFIWFSVCATKDSLLNTHDERNWKAGFEKILSDFPVAHEKELLHEVYNDGTFKTFREIMSVKHSIPTILILASKYDAKSGTMLFASNEDPMIAENIKVQDVFDVLRQSELVLTMFCTGYFSVFAPQLQGFKTMSYFLTFGCEGVSAKYLQEYIHFFFKNLVSSQVGTPIPMLVFNAKAKMQSLAIIRSDPQLAKDVSRILLN